MVPLRILVILAVMPFASAAHSKSMEQTLTAGDQASIHLTRGPDALRIDYRAPAIGSPNQAVYLLIGGSSAGSAVVPYEKGSTGSTVFLPFPADRLYAAIPSTDGTLAFQRDWLQTAWGPRQDAKDEIALSPGQASFTIPTAALSGIRTLRIALYAKDLGANGGWGKLWGCSDSSLPAGTGDKYIPHCWQIDLHSTKTPLAVAQGRYGADLARVRIYQLFVRLFGNTNETRKPNGTLAENGSGKFNDINDAALTALQSMGFSHIWLTGILRQATGTDYTQIGLPADDPDLLKGIAGSPYAIKDYFDVCPDYAEKPAERLAEFQALLHRIHGHGMKAIIDLVANHVARSYGSTVHPELDFGAKGHGGDGDDRTAFFDPQNNFFYLQPGPDGPPLQLPTFKDGSPVSPTCKVPGMKCDGRFDGESEFGRVTGNNVVSWKPSLGDWYETVKLNYGFDFTDPAKKRREYPNGADPASASKPLPDTWLKVDKIIAYWQAMGVDGFRCDMSHMMPPEFWAWAIARARERKPDVFFMGEAYDSDPAKVPGGDPVLAGLNGGKGNVMYALLNAGFNAVYDDPSYRALKNIYDGSGWANDVDHALPDDFIFENSVRYAENHDEARLAGKGQWGNIGMEAGRPVCGILFGLSRGAVMLYNGQEVGEPAAGAEGFGGDDARSSIFDYWSMPEMVKWVSGHRYDGARLADPQKALREFYARLVRLVNEPAFRNGAFLSLNRANNGNPAFGSLPGESAGGHWIYAFLRYDAATGQRFLVVTNLHKEKTFENIPVRFPPEALAFLGIEGKAGKLHLTERLAGKMNLTQDLAQQTSGDSTLTIPAIPPLTPCYFEISLIQ